MSAPIDFPVTLQRLLMAAYKGTGLGDDSLVAYLQARFQAGSAALVSGWRNGTRNMPLDALDAVLEHCDGEHRTHLLNVLCQRHGHRAVPEVEATATADASSELLDVVQRTGELAATLRVAKADGRIDEAEIKLLDEQVERLTQEVAELRAALHPRVRTVTGGAR